LGNYTETFVLYVYLLLYVAGAGLMCGLVSCRK